jgi:hypoxanthine-guanine phosphoribosyltransferase
VSQAELERAISETLIDEETLKRRVAELGEEISND